MDSLSQTEVQETAGVVSTQEIRAVADLLQISPEGLQKAITFKMTVHTSIMCSEQQHVVFWASFILI